MNDFIYSYTDFIRERNFFKMVDDSGINRYDVPSALYYKIVFYFSDNGLLGIYNITNEPNESVKNIRGITPAFINGNKEKDTSAKLNGYRNTAYNYLLVNDEIERAEMLKQFIILLSDINSSSPWYFQEITGLDNALERKMFSEREIKLEEKPRQITIKCLQDAYDNRIGTLLDLYRAACFSYQNKKEIVPANLRKFNMGILVFSAPIRGKSGKSGDKYNMITIPDSDAIFYIPSAKLIEFRNCEFDYNSSKSAWSTLNTTDNPFSPEYTIGINYDDAYESRYNDIMDGVVTDFINIDIFSGSKIYPKERDSEYMFKNVKKITPDNEPMQINFKRENEGKDYWLNTDIGKINSNPSEIYVGEVGKGEIKPEDIGTVFGANVLTTQLNNIKDKVSDFVQLPSIDKRDNIHDNGTVNKLGEFEYLNRLSGMGGFVGNVMQQAVGTATSALKDKVSQVYLGNIRSLSVSNMLDMGKRVLSGDIAGTISTAKRYSDTQIGEEPIIGKKLPEYNGKDNLQRREIGFEPTTKEIHDGGVINRELNKGAVLDVDIINHTLGAENGITEKHFTTKEIWTDEDQRKLGFNPITKEIHDGGVINRELNKGAVLDVDIINHTLGTENETSETLFTTNEIWDDPTQRTINPSNGELWSDPTQRDLGFEPITNEIWTDPFQRNIDSDSIGELPGYIKNRTKFLNEMNTKQSIRNNI